MIHLSQWEGQQMTEVPTNETASGLLWKGIAASTGSWFNRYMNAKWFFVISMLGILPVCTQAQQPPLAVPGKTLYVLDVAGGKILGAAFGMDEATVRKALEDNNFGPVAKVVYP